VANAAIIGGVMTVVDDMNMKVREFYGEGAVQAECSELESAWLKSA
jgi:hypothetical protein